MNLFGRKDKKKEEKRPARFAGTWYEEDADKLRSELDEYLSAARRDFDDQEDLQAELSDRYSLLAIIVPHAGYMFSGSTSAFAYHLAGLRKPKRVFLLGPSHYVGFQGVALSPDKIFETPLGDLKLDRKTIDDLTSYPMFEEAREIHQREHSLELQLPFIRHTLGDVPIVPMIVGTLSDITDVRMIGQILKRYMSANDLVVISSDFTHYGPRYDYAPFCGDVPAKVKELDLEAFACLKNRDLEGFLDFHERTECTICGFYPCSVLLSMLPELSQAKLLKYGTSRDTSFEDKENSVSYLAISFDCPSTSGWGSESGVRKDELLNESEKTSLLKLARKAVEVYCHERRVLNVEDAGIELTPALRRPLGAFVTLFKKRSDEPPIASDPDEKERCDHDLRGCIGYIWPIKPLYEAVIDNAVGACSKDYRFHPVSGSELPLLKLEISVLTPLQRVASTDDIVLGKHGIVLYAKGRQSVFLPHVATEFGWTLAETLDQLCLKAGLAAGEWRQNAKFDVFESIMFEEGEIHN